MQSVHLGPLHDPVQQGRALIFHNHDQWLSQTVSRIRSILQLIAFENRRVMTPHPTHPDGVRYPRYIRQREYIFPRYRERSPTSYPSAYDQVVPSSR